MTDFERQVRRAALLAAVTRRYRRRQLRRMSVGWWCRHG
jgi:hypothetical protein